MKNKDLIAKVTAFAEPVCREAGVSLWDVTFEKEGSSYVLTVYIDREEGVFIEDCEKVSRAIDPMLDAPEFDSLPSYTLSVSSAGLQRKLVRPEHFAWAKGRKVEICVYKGDPVIGELAEKDENGVTVRIGDELKTVAAADTAAVRLYFE